MKILHVNTYDTGGAGKACLRIHRALVDQGCDSQVLLLHKTQGDDPRVHEVWDILNPVTKTSKLAAKKFKEQQHRKQIRKITEPVELYSMPDTIWDITEDPRYAEADIIHLHWIAGLLDLTTFFAKCDKPIVWTTHDYHPFLGGFHYPCEQDEAFAALSRSNLDLMVGMDSHPIHLTPPSTFLADELVRMGQFRNVTAQAIKNPSNTSVFSYRDRHESRTKLGLDADARYVLFVADRTDYKRKGMDLLLDAIGSMDHLHLLVVGEGRLDLSSVSAIEYGRIDDEHRLATIYGAADVYVIPSRMDNLPNTVSEALLCGTPVAGFRVGGIPEMVADGVNGELSDALDGTGLATAIRNVLDGQWDRKGISDQAAIDYDPAQIAHHYLTVYQELLPDQ